MSEYDKMHDYLNDQTFYDKFPEAWKVKKLYDEKVKDLERQLAKHKEAIRKHRASKISWGLDKSSDDNELWKILKD